MLLLQLGNLVEVYVEGCIYLFPLLPSSFFILSFLCVVRGYKYLLNLYPSWPKRRMTAERLVIGLFYTSIPS